MKRKMFWIASGILLLALLVMQITFHSNSSNMFGATMYALVTSIIQFTFGVLPASILSFIPYKNWPYGKKFGALLPITLFFVLVIWAFVFGFIEYQTQVKGMKILI